jgi:penicillin-binding protein A
MGRVRWLEPAGRRRHPRRHRRRMPVVPLLLLIAVLACAGGVGWVLLAREAAADRRQAVAERFAAAWTRGDHAGMWRMLTPARRRDWALSEFRASYRIADQEATVEAVRAGPPAVTGSRVTLPVSVRTRIFGRLAGTMTLTVKEQDGEAYLDWSPSLRLPGLRDGENVKRRVLARPARRPVLASDGSRLAEEPSAVGIAGTPPVAGEPGTGLERLYDRRLGGRPGAELLFGKRIVRKVDVRRGHALRTTIRPGIQAAATAALGDRLGGVAVIRPRTGDVLALAGLAVSGPQPPGSTFKIVTLAAALQERVARPSSSYPVQTSATLSGVKLRNASDESCGGSLATSFAHSCNSVFAPLGAKLGARRLVRYAEAFGFNEELPLPGFKPSAIPEPRELKDDLAVGAAAIGQERDLATPLTMASVGATIANRGVRARPRIVRGRRAVRHRAVSARVARQVREMMLGVVRGGTGTAAALPGVEVAGKTGTAELVPTAGGPSNPENTDAWFVAFAPASRPRVAVGAMLIGAGAGGAAAAPVAREVLAAAL